MAGDWIKMQVCLPDKPEVWQIATRLSLDADSVVGKLLRVWSWFDAHTEDGNAAGVSFSLVDRVAGVTGFAESMMLCGWLEQHDTTLTMPRFDRHNGKSSKNRALTAERVAKLRNARSVTEPLPEKRREEKKEKTQKPAASRLVSLSDLVADGVDQRAAEDWMTNRKAKGLPLTPTAWAQTKSEAAKAKLTPAEAVSVAAGNGWAGFKASWATGTAMRDAGVSVTVPSSDNGRTAAMLAAQAEHAKHAVPPPREILEALKKSIVRVT